MTAREKAESSPRPVLHQPPIPRVLRLCAAASKCVCCSVSLMEVALILGHHPSWTYSAFIPTSLLPFVRLWSLRLTWSSVAGCTLGIIGGFICTQCAGRTLGRSSSGETAARDDRKLITDGPYSLVRYPDYMGECLLMAGNVLLLASRGSWFTEGGLWNTVVGKGLACSVIAFVASVALRRFWMVEKEDELLREEFGQQWDEWARRTPYRLIPFIY
ncbi:hypothetical protein BD309DRAFT_877058 [Dichomitus squalens]|uniref:Uncharacterized protein n=1 Tax=Dichomitus squalens TaxID=114155 RepID=A0A4Q9NA33_9APHY|nr:hypothetical protein BD309DRAFT_877058 [Dichomitus squalens]TBU58242.1 hypothetical protein BD310DRAFT_819931 [Dichomitus squalens]